MDFHKDKVQKIHEILSIVKLGSMLFLGLIVLNTIFDTNELIFNSEKSYYNFLWSTLIILCVSLFYSLWTFVIIKKFEGKKLVVVNIIESIIILVIFCTTILVSGSFESEYKIIFLFLIISSTIQIGLAWGLILSVLSALFLLGLDLFTAPTHLINFYFSNDLIICAVFLFTALPLGYYVRLEKEHIMILEDLANIDGLTGLYNHRYFHEKLSDIYKQCSDSNEIFSLIFMDLDYFKEYNDSLGHQKGDELLRKVGEILNDICHGDIIVARYGGDEFAAIIRDMEKNDVYALSEIIRKTIEKTQFEGENNLTDHKLTMSIGIAFSNEKIKNETDMIKYVDDALYRAKFYNKNRVELYSSVFEALKIDIEDSHIDLITSIKTLISVINSKDKYTYGHVERVVVYVKALADELGLCEADKRILIYGAYMHDVGKINIDPYILNKKTPLSQDEWELIKKHPEDGASIIKPVGILLDTIPLILHHHERYDGNGYPHGLKGESIPYLTRILTVADSFDAMTSSRPYSKAKTFKEGIEELKRCSGIQFDGKIVERFEKIINDDWCNKLPDPLIKGMLLEEDN